jgi:hypothetical protein
MGRGDDKKHADRPKEKEAGRYRRMKRRRRVRWSAASCAHIYARSGPRTANTEDVPCEVRGHPFNGKEFAHG